jgi:hypothetical protein
VQRQCRLAVTEYQTQILLLQVEEQWIQQQLNASGDQTLPAVDGTLMAAQLAENERLLQTYRESINFYYLTGGL